MIKLASVAGLALALSISSTFAADLPSLKAPIVAPPPAFSWTGLYGGVNIGYGFGNSDRDPGWLEIQPYVAPCCTLLLPSPAWSISNDPHGVLGGGQVGYNFQFNPWLVFGLEADIQASDVHSQGNGSGSVDGIRSFGPSFAYASQNKSVDWFGTVRGRVGVTFPNLPNLLLYVTGGLAYGDVVHSANVSDFFPSAGVPLSRPPSLAPARITIRRRSAGRPAAASSGSRCPRIRCGAPFPSSLNISTLTLARRRSMVRPFRNP